MPKFFSQNGEDCLLWQILKNKPDPGYYVEAGALDGKRFSNTFALELLGWTGICIEAHPDYYALLKDNRPNSQNVFAAVGGHDAATTFYTNERGSLSTLNPNLESTWRKNHSEYFSGFKPIPIQMKTLTTILNEKQAPKSFDVLSIDVEGVDFQALQGLDLKIYRPRFIIIEAYEQDDEFQISEHLKVYNYFVARKVSNNLIFSENEQDAEYLAQLEIDCELIYSPHPLDHADSEVVQKLHLSKATSSKQSKYFVRFRNRIKHHVRKFQGTIFPPKNPKLNLSPVYEKGFHGDKYLLSFVDTVVPFINAFIETGTNVGTTSRYMAAQYPHLLIYSCEPNEVAFNKARKTLKEFGSRVKISPVTSPNFLYDIHKEYTELNNQVNLYWLDAHQHDYKWPLDQELQFITNNQEQAIIMIDDAEVPGHPEFLFSKYENQVCDVDYITSALTHGRTYQLIHPNYTEHTSSHHALIGVVIVAFGINLEPNEFFSSRTVVK